MPSSHEFFDIVVIGSHPAAYVAAVVALLDSPKIRLLHLVAPGGKTDDRLVTINPKLAELHPALAPFRLRTELNPKFGLQFLSDAAAVRGQFVSKNPAWLIGALNDVTQAVAAIADRQKVRSLRPRSLQITRVIDEGVQMSVDAKQIVARVAIVACDLPAEQQRVLGMSTTWEPGVVQRYSFINFQPAKGALNFPSARTVPMSLDLAGTSGWGWLLDGGASAQLATLLPSRLAAAWPASKLMKVWIDQLALHGIVKAPTKLAAGITPLSIDLPVAGALSAETVANRTLLIGPAGGFYSACGEDIYPNCWSAVAAAQVALEAIGQKHIQDGLQAYREKWGTKLGDYLRGPQQNLKLLLPLVYRNEVMAARVAEAILFGESVVR